MTKDQIKATGPRRIYILSPEERLAIAASRAGGLASDEEADAFWKRQGVVRSRET
jgi:hypothetical protein